MSSLLRPDQGVTDPHDPVERLSFGLVLVFAFTVPWEDLGGLKTGGSVSRIAGMLATACWLAKISTTRRLRKPSLFHLLVMAFVAWVMLTFFWTIDVARTHAHIIMYLQTALLAYLLWDLVTTPARVRAVLQSYVAGTLVCLFGVLRSYSAGLGYTSTRFSAGDVNPNTLAFALAMAVPTALELAPEAKPRWLRVLNLAYAPLATYAILLTGSRAGFAGALVGGGYILASQLRRSGAWRLLLVPALAGLLATSIAHAPEQSLDRIQGAGSDVTEGDWTGRLEIWREGLKAFYEHPRPLLGVGGGAFKSAIRSGRAPHSPVLALLTELGIPGLLVYGSILAVVTYYAVKQSGRTGLWLAVGATWVISAAVHNFEDTKLTWLFLSLVVASAFAGSGVREEPAPSAATPPG